MRHRNILAPGTALLAAAVTLSLVPAAMAGTSHPKVSIRVEGKSRTLLPATLAGGSTTPVRKAGHSCPGNTVVGAFNRAVRGDWSAVWFTGLGFDVNRILGETADYTKTKRYYELFVNNVPAVAGICSLRLHTGEQVLFASVPDTGTEFPLGLQMVRNASVHRSVALNIVAYDAMGKAHPVQGVTVAVRGGHGGSSTLSVSRGGKYAVTFTRAGTYTVVVRKAGFIRDEAKVKVRL